MAAVTASHGGPLAPGASQPEAASGRDPGPGLASTQGPTSIAGVAALKLEQERPSELPPAARFNAAVSEAPVLPRHGMILTRRLALAGNTRRRARRRFVGLCCESHMLRKLQWEARPRPHGTVLGQLKVATGRLGVRPPGIMNLKELTYGTSCRPTAL